MTKHEKINPIAFAGMNLIKGVSLESVLDAACNITGAKKEDVTSKARQKPLPYTRQLYSFVAYSLNQKLGSERQEHRSTLTEIGALINIDHSTVISHTRKIESYFDLYDDIKDDVETIKAKINVNNSCLNTGSIDNSSIGYYDRRVRKEFLKMYAEKNDVVTKMKM